MKKTYMHEGLAMVTGMVGAFVLVVGLMPFINPGLVDLHHSGDYSPRMEFLVPTLISLPILGVSWRLNKKAQAIRKTLSQTPPGPELAWQNRVKWIIFVIVVLLILSVFLW
jgi:hypothetical protein